jgi:hypothetical protein
MWRGGFRAGDEVDMNSAVIWSGEPITGDRHGPDRFISLHA